MCHVLFCPQHCYKQPPGMILLQPSPPHSLTPKCDPIYISLHILFDLLVNTISPGPILFQQKLAQGSLLTGPLGRRFESAENLPPRLPASTTSQLNIADILGHVLHVTWTLTHSETSPGNLRELLIITGCLWFLLWFMTSGFVLCETARQRSMLYVDSAV